MMEQLRTTGRVTLWVQGAPIWAGAPTYYVTGGQSVPFAPGPCLILWCDNDRERAEREYARLDAEEAARQVAAREVAAIAVTEEEGDPFDPERRQDHDDR